ncbi:MAG TPA: CarD family transcriptional regulator [Anaerolineales bacterium]|nr:CarD family transcriptional regulator [Anaerolineales bacterium]
MLPVPVRNAAASGRIAGGTTGGAINIADRSMFEIGDRVVHPQHGVGQIVKLEDREFERGDTQRYYEIHIPGGSTVWVPVDLSNSGLRRLADKSELGHCREILKSRPLPLMEDGRVRQSALAAHLKQGTIAAQCEVVRDLSAFVAHKPTYGTITAFLEAILRVLCQEWAMVEGMTIPEAMAEINSLLERSE